MSLPTCYKCGGPADLAVEDGSAVCERCEGEYQAFLEATYPYGQCWQCGAEYRPWTCQFGTIHVVASHSEGGCSGWRDREPSETQCPEGCYQPGLWTAGEMWDLLDHGSYRAFQPVYSYAIVADSADPPLDDEMDLPF